MSHWLDPAGVGERVRPLDPELTADHLFSSGQKAAVAAVAVGAAALTTVVVTRVRDGRGRQLLGWAGMAMAAASTVNLVGSLYQSAIVLRGALADRDLTAPVTTVADEELPGYTVLVPLYREERVLPRLVEELSALDYPEDRLQIILIVEESDRDTRMALSGLELPPTFEVALIKQSMPRSKPKACNVALRQARGRMCVIYDAEDRPDPGQLRAAVQAFAQAPPETVCMQAELQLWNPLTNWLTRCFAAEYATRHALYLPGLSRCHLPILLGGTSNHFRMEALLELGAWDGYNMTEDADLGVRIYRRGWRVETIASVTEEEANSELGNWMRQRSRWIKGHAQTWLVHTRHPVRLWRDLGPTGFLSLQFSLAYPLVHSLSNPVLLALNLSLLKSRAVPRRIRRYCLATTVAATLTGMTAVSSGCVLRGLRGALPAVPTAPVYWTLIWAAGLKGVIQLLRPSRRHFWEVTRHGLVDDAGRRITI
ncbi:glycosyltransferase [Streptomyces lavendulae]|uniref:glycosyltransferase n=1 Tax=Streptomyces lavendulae TaxID=1914 RepID=UPI0036B41277